MIRADAYTPDVWEAICTPMHEILPSSPPNPNNSHSSAPARGALYLGSWTAAVDPELLARHGVKAIVECLDAPWGVCESSSSTTGGGGGGNGELLRTPTSPNLSAGRPAFARSATSTGHSYSHSSSHSHHNGGGGGGGGGGQIGRFKVSIPDSPAPDLLAPHLDGAVRFIRERLNRGENVLVHCQQGISRSPAIVCAFLMRERALSYDAAVQVVRSRRKCAKPNAGFERTLRNWK